MDSRIDITASPDMHRNSTVPPSQEAVDWIEAHSNGAVVLLMVFFFCVEITEASGRPFWYDEMFTYSLATLPSWRQICLAMPPDGNPPLYVFLSRFFIFWLKPQELALRMPSLLAYTASLGLLFALVRKRLGTVCGLLAAVLLAVHPFANYYASEARPYALVLFFACLGLWSWQLAVDSIAPRRLFLILLSLAVAGTVLSHHLGIVGLGLAILCGELVRVVMRRRIDFGVVTAMMLGLCALLFTLPMMHATRTLMLQDVDVNQRLSLGRLFTSYTDASLGWSTPFLLLLVLSVVVFFIQSGIRGFARLSSAWPPHELAALIGGTATLLVIFVMLRISTGYYAGPRYGFAVFVCLSAICAGIARLYPRSVQLVLCIVALAAFPRPHQLQHAASKEVSCLNALPHDPIAIARGLYYPTAWHYADSELRTRLFYPFGAEKEVSGKRWIESSALILAQGMMHMKAEPFHQFLGSTSSFLLVTDGDHQPDEEELERFLQSNGYRKEQMNVRECNIRNLNVERVSAQ